MTPERRKIVLWAVLRIVLGQMQMIGALASVIVFARMGFVTPVPQLFAATTAVTFTSILIFRVLRLHERTPTTTLPMKKLLAEFLGTFTLVFAGTGAIVVNAASHGAITHAGIALTFGLVVLAMIHTFGDISGAHLNPAVTLGFAVARRFGWHEVPGYLVAQAAGAFAASGLLHGLFPADATLGATLPAGSAAQSFVLEVVLTAVLMLVILSVSTGAKEKGITAGIAIGSVIALEAMFAGPICGASMNPARSLAPALVSGHLEHLWIYLTGPLVGALIAMPLCIGVREPGCCTPLSNQSNTQPT